MPGKLFPLQQDDRLLSWFIGLLAFLYYLFIPMQELGYDANNYVLQMVSGDAQQLFHPHHLLYVPFNWLFNQLCLVLTLPLSPIRTMAVLNSILGALGIVIAYRLFWRLSGRRLVSFLISLSLAVSWNYHKFSAMAETVIPEVFLLLLVLYLILGAKKLETGKIIKLGLLTSLIMLFHQISIIFLPLFSFLLFIKINRSRRTLGLTVYLTSTLLPVLILYLLVMMGINGIGSIHGGWVFLTRYAQEGVWGRGRWFDVALGFKYWLNTAGNVFLYQLVWDAPSVCAAIGRGLIWGLVIFGVVMSIRSALHGEWFGICLGIYILLVMFFVDWWSVTTSDFWLFPWILWLGVIAWASRELKGRILALWLIFFIPAQTVMSWYYPLGEKTNPERVKNEEYAMNVITYAYSPQNTILLVKDDWRLVVRAQIAGIKAIVCPRNQQKTAELIRQVTSLIANPQSHYLLLMTQEVILQYQQQIAPKLPVRERFFMDKAIAQARMMVFTKDGWGRELRIWQLNYPQNVR